MFPNEKCRKGLRYLMDEEYGVLRVAIGDAKANADGRQLWEVSMAPESICALDDELGNRLKLLLKAASCKLLQSASQSLLFLWGMEGDGKIMIAVEEVAQINEQPVPKGFPTRRGLPKKLTLDHKLGHPCIMSSNQARIAGELYIDAAPSNDGTLVWMLNARSGRFHEPPERRPTDGQLRNVAKLFASAIGEAIEIERLTQFAPFSPAPGV
jgi:hypothetical protein